MNHSETHLVRYTAKQLASTLLRQIALAYGISEEEMRDNWRLDLAKLHFHDGSHGGIAFNDMHAIQMYNEASGQSLPVPEVATQGYNQHGHTSEYDGGLIVALGNHDHRDNVTGGGYCFAVYAPGTKLPSQPWAI